MSVVKDLINQVDPTKDRAKETKELLQLLYELSEEKANVFRNEILTNLRTAGTQENKTIPVSAQLATHKEIRVTTKSTPDKDIIDTIGSGLKDMLGGTTDGIIGGLSNIVFKGLQVVLGCGEGEERREDSYFVSTDGLSIVRLDMIHWCRNINASGITDYAEKSVVSTVVKSSVDLTKIDFNTFLAVYKNQLQNSGLEAKEILEEIENAKKVYHSLSEKDTIPCAENLLSDFQDCGRIAYTCNAVDDVAWPCLPA